MSESRRHQATFSILFCDIDRFKAVNDRQGHAVGDMLLQRVATAIRAAARGEDLVARYGGDEIALLLPETGRFGALDLARRCARRSSGPALTGIDSQPVAVFPDDAADPESLIARADAAMYAGKRWRGWSSCPRAAGRGVARLGATRRELVIRPAYEPAGEAISRGRVHTSPV
jgi:diguanylate cyclase (GGDEF)-like protein